MRNHSVFSALWRAPIFNKSIYQDAAQNWRGIGALYLLLLVMLMWLAVIIKCSRGFSHFVTHEAPAALKDFPTINIVKGEVSSDVPQPYIMRESDGTAVFVLDTTGEITDPTKVGAQLLLTRTELIQV